VEREADVNSNVASGLLSS